MFLIVGLGNPGKKYENTRHNVGSRIIDELESLEFGKVILVKPATFMNESGKAIKSLYTKYKIRDTRYLIIVHDDIDLPLGSIKISKGSGSAGHKGVQSIIDTLGTKNFLRLRVGIQPKSGKPDRAEDFVLKKFTKSEEKILKEIIGKSLSAIETIIKDGPEKAMNEFNQ